MLIMFWTLARLNLRSVPGDRDEGAFRFVADKEKENVFENRSGQARAVGIFVESGHRHPGLRAFADEVLVAAIAVNGSLKSIVAAPGDGIDGSAGEITLAHVERRDVYTKLIDRIEADRLRAFRWRARAAAGRRQAECVADRRTVHLDVVRTVVLSRGRCALASQGADLRREPDVIVQAPGNRWQIVDFLPIDVGAGARCGPSYTDRRTAVLSTTTRSVVVPSGFGGRRAPTVRGGSRPNCRFTSAVSIRVVKMPERVLVWPLAEAVIRNGPPVRTLAMSQRPPSGSRKCTCVPDDVSTAIISAPTTGLPARRLSPIPPREDEVTPCASNCVGSASRRAIKKKNQVKAIFLMSDPFLALLFWTRQKKTKKMNRFLSHRCLWRESASGLLRLGRMSSRGELRRLRQKDNRPARPRS